MREITKEVTHEIEGTEWRFMIKKMDALRGSFLMKFCAEKLMPVFNKMQTVFQGDSGKTYANEEEKKAAADAMTAEAINMLVAAIAAISEEELITFEKRCLSTVRIFADGEWTKIMDGDQICVGILEYDTMTVLLLCYDVLEFNLSGFFGGSSLGSLLPRQNT